MLQVVAHLKQADARKIFLVCHLRLMGCFVIAAVSDCGYS